MVLLPTDTNCVQRSFKNSSGRKLCDVKVIHEALGGLLAVIKCVMSRVVSVAETPQILGLEIKVFFLRFIELIRVCKMITQVA